MPRRFRFVGKKRYVVLTLLVLPVALLFNVIVVTLLLLNPRSWRFNRTEAEQLLEDRLARYRRMSWSECAALAEGEPFTEEALGRSGERYQVEIQVFWERCQDGPLRVLGSIDDGRLRAYAPLSRSWVLKPEKI